MSKWKTAKLTEVANIERMGVQPDQIKDGTTYVGLEHIETGGKFIGLKPVNNGDLASSKFQFTDQHILYGKLRPYLAKIACPEVNGICSTDILPILPKSSVDRKFLFHFLRQPKMIDYANSLAVGVNLPRLNPSVLANFEIPLPPLEEQKRIAEILDRAEEIRSKRREAIAQLDTLTQAIFLEMFGAPVRNPKGWEVRNMNECAERIQIGPFGTQLHEEDYIDNGIPLVNPTHIQDGKIFPNTSFSISNEKHQQLSQYHLEVDDVILGRRGEMGRCAIVSKNEHGWLCGTGSLFIRPKNTLINSVYLFSILSNQSIKKYLEKASQGVTMANLNKTIVSQIPVVLPPLSLQQKFAHHVESVEKLKAAHCASLSEIDALFSSLQHRAFRGEL